MNTPVSSQSDQSLPAKNLHIGIVIGESSGDILGASLVRALRDKYPNIRFSGIGGPLMNAQGFESLFDYERLAVMGFVDPLKRLPELLNIRKSLFNHFIDQQPDLFIGIDAPDFNLGLAKKLRQQGLLTAHYVSPSVWAWRQGRVKSIAQSIDRMLTLFPFEAQFYRDHQVPVTFVGHPLADEIPLQCDQLAARKTLGLEDDTNIKYIAIMPGSRAGEVDRLGKIFLETAHWCKHQRQDLKFIIPAANDERFKQLQGLIEQFAKGLDIKLITAGQSRTVMTAADAVLMASGTTALEALLLKKPMVVAYRLSWLNYQIAKRLVKSAYISLPNLLAQEMLVPEVLQNDVKPELLGPLVIESLNDNPVLLNRYDAIHQQLRQGASLKAAEVISKMLQGRR